MSGKRAASIKFEPPIRQAQGEPKVVKAEAEIQKPSQFEEPILETPQKTDYDNTPKNPSRFTSTFLIVLFLLALGATGYTYKLYKDSQAQVKKLKNPTEVAKVETQQLVDTVGKLIALPKETPTIATIVDIKKLENQPFFAKASNGDKVLIFTQSKKAILYNPKSNKIIEVAPINIGQNKDEGVAGESTKAEVTPTTAVSPTP